MDPAAIQDPHETPGVGKVLAAQTDRVKGERHPLTENHTEANENEAKEQGENPYAQPFEAGREDHDSLHHPYPEP